MKVVEYPDDADPERTARLRGDQGGPDDGYPQVGRYLWRLIATGIVLGIVRWLAG